MIRPLPDTCYNKCELALGTDEGGRTRCDCFLEQVSSTCSNTIRGDHVFWVPVRDFRKQR